MPVHALNDERRGDNTETVRARVAQARALAAERGATNESADLVRALKQEARELLFLAIDPPGLSLRAYNKILRVSRTLADLEGNDALLKSHVAEAIQYRALDREPGQRFEPSTYAAPNGVQ